MFFVLFPLLAHVALVLATSVSVFFPLNSQLPPVARTNASFSWAFSDSTFVSERNSTLVYSASPLPAWLSFDSATRTFRGTPSSDDEGTPHIKVVAKDPDTSDSASSSVSLCVTSYPAPNLTISVSSQFRPDNPSLSSVFLLSEHSALQEDNPTLRIPSSWSFSIGFEGNTFTSPDGIQYAALQVDGSPLPPWMVFDPRGITLDGVAPPVRSLPTPYVLSLALHASDEDGFSIASVPFNVVIASRELHTTSGTLPTINITSSSNLDVSLNSPIDYAGVLVDGSAIDTQDVALLEIDTLQYTWLHYDTDSRRLTGQPPDDLSTGDKTVLPVILTTSFNQTLRTLVEIAVVPSFFLQPSLPPILAGPGQDVHFSLTQFFSNATYGDDVNLTASYEPKDADAYLHFDTSTALLSGTIPSSGINYNHITASFTAYSRVTHSTSHTSLPISLTPADYKHTQPTVGPGARMARKKLALALGITFGLIGGMLGLGFLLAVFRRWAHTPDSALTGAAAARAMSGNERQWYGIGNIANAEADDDDAEKGYGTDATGRYRELGLGLARAATHTSSSGDGRTLASPGQLSKAEFMGRLRATVRNVSNRYRRARKSAIGKPVLVLEADHPRVPNTPATPGVPALAGYEPVDYPGAVSSLHGSPSSSTGDRSIPQRRPDFAPPRAPVPAVTPARRSVDSVMSLASDSSMRSHAAEAVVQRAARARSVRSVRSTSAQSHKDDGARIVPFTAGHALAPLNGAGTTGDRAVPARASSLSASVVRVPTAPAGEVDDLHVGLRYVRALGEDAREASGSFSSLESSHRARSSVGSSARGDVLRVLVRVGERFRFRLPVRAGASSGSLSARRASGELLPAFLYADLDTARGDRHRDTVKFWGVPRADDVGEVHVGVYSAERVCVAQAVIEVLARGG
ncbi:hypothetical protein BC834DRAFT_833608 [Gloeopeniophorella convolvens]|nr:hypothetical protein BC834DRAFT_833608 [Gloeopeniophorella convolvens]